MASAAIGSDCPALHACRWLGRSNFPNLATIVPSTINLEAKGVEVPNLERYVGPPVVPCHLVASNN